MAKKWIQKATEREGVFTAKAKAAGMSVQEYARFVLRHKERFSTRTIRQAVIALRAKQGWKGPIKV